jgi:hypothetical protein
MPDEGWWPSRETRLIFRHLVVIIAVALALWVATRVFGFLTPDWAPIADAIDGFINMGVLIIGGFKLLWGLARGDGTHAFAVA